MEVITTVVTPFQTASLKWKEKGQEMVSTQIPVC